MIKLYMQDTCFMFLVWISLLLFFPPFGRVGGTRPITRGQRRGRAGWCNSIPRGLPVTA